MDSPVTAIDKANRNVTLEGPQGSKSTVTAGPEVRNFDRMKVGDQVEAAYAEAMATAVTKAARK